MSILNEIEDVFIREDEIFTNIEDVCRSIHASDTEGVDETFPFLGLRWQQVSPFLWKQNSFAIGFFTDKAFYYYLPSLIYCSYINIDCIELNLMGLLTEFRIVYYFLNKKENRDYGHDFYYSTHERICQIKDNEMMYMIKWFDYIVDIGELDEDETAKARYVISHIMKERKKSLGY